MEKSKSELLNKCKCQEKAVKRKGSNLKTITCKGCGKVIKSNRNSDFCFECERH